MQDKNEYHLWKPTEKCLKWPICTRLFVVFAFCVAASKVSTFGIFMVHIFPHSDWVLRDSCHLFVLCWNVQIRVRIRKTPNTETFHAVCVLTCASVHYSVPAYTVTTLTVMLTFLLSSYQLVATDNGRPTQSWGFFFHYKITHFKRSVGIARSLKQVPFFS